MLRINGVDIYTIQEAIDALRISEATLNRWVEKAHLRQPMDRQRFPDDLRQRYLTREQVELLAGQHRRTLQETPTQDIEAVESGLSERIDALEAWKAGIERRVSALEVSRSQFKPIPGRKKPGTDGE